MGSLIVFQAHTRNGVCGRFPAADRASPQLGAALSGFLRERGSVIGCELLEGAGRAAKERRDIVSEPPGVAAGDHGERLGVHLSDLLGDAGRIIVSLS